MSNRQPEDLAKSSYLTLVVRMRLDTQHNVRGGELVDLEGETVGRFANWQGLLGALRKSLGGSEQDGTQQ